MKLKLELVGRFLPLTLALSCLFALGSGCSSSPNLSVNQNRIQRSWVRRMVPESKLTSNEISQEASPLVLDSGNILQGTNFGGLSELTFYGKKVWSLTQGFEFISGSPSVFKNFVFFGTSDKKLHAFDRNEKKIIWSIGLQTAVSAISEFKNGFIFILTTKGQIYSINAADGSVNWTKYVPSRKELTIYGGPKPIVYGSSVFAAFPNGSVVSFDLKNGKTNWSLNLPGAQKFEDADFMMLAPNEALYVGVYDEALYRVDPLNGSIKWQAFEKPVSAVSLYLNKLYFSSKEGDLVILQADSGNLISKTKLFKGIGGRPLFLKDKMVVADSKGPIRAYQLNPLKELASYDLISPVSADMSSNASGSKFYLISDHGYLYSLGLR